MAINTSASLPVLHEDRNPRGRVWSTSSVATPPSKQPTLTHSTSTPSLSHKVTSNSPYNSPSTPSSNSKSSKNYHPYLIQSTSSSLLTRSNSSPAQPQVVGHRSSRSFSSYEYIGVGFESENSASEYDRRKSLDGCASPTPLVNRGKGMVRSGRSGTLPSFLDTKKDETVQKTTDLPMNPKTWTPSELATYLSQTLRSGGEDGSGQRLPAPLVEDIKTWVLRHQVSGRSFIRGNSETWGPPPFLTLLQSISRKLRRASIQGQAPDPMDDTSSVLLETDEEEEPENVTGVKRMANAFELRESASLSDAAFGSDMDEAPKLKAQLTGGSEGWERWGLKRQNTGLKIGKEKKVDLLASSPEEDIVTPLIEQDIKVGIVDEDDGEQDEDQVETIKALPSEPIEPSPPPPYTSPAPGTDTLNPDYPTRLTVSRCNSTEGTPKADGKRKEREVTPTPDRVLSSPSGLGFSIDDSLEAESNSSPRQERSPSNSRYSSLRGKGRVPSIRGNLEDGYTTSDEAPRQGSRRTTLRPTTTSLNKLFEREEKTQRELELESQLSQVLDRVKVLEERLAVVSRPGSPVSDSSVSGVMELIFGRVGKRENGDDGLPRRVGELPAYLFLVGFGVGAVMMRVLFGRAR